MIGIIGAMPEEILEIKEQIQNLEVIQHSPRTFYKGTISNQEVVLVLAGIGKTNAAVTTTLLLELFDIKQVINIGVAGGQNGVKHNDIVVSSSVLYHEVDVTSFGRYVAGQVPGHSPEFLADKVPSCKRLTHVMTLLNHLHVVWGGLTRSPFPVPCDRHR